MIGVREIDHLVLRVSDVAAMLAFYRDVLGCPIERRQDDIGLIQLRAGRSLIDLVPVDGALGRAGGAAPGPEGRNLDHFCLRVEPFDEDAIRARLHAHGIVAGPIASRYGAEGEGPSLYLTDPEGNVVELKGPAKTGAARVPSLAAPVAATGTAAAEVTVRRLGPGDSHVLDDVAAEVFDQRVDPRLAREFLADPRHHLVVACVGTTVVGMATALHYVHPDKPAELWINEVGVAPPYRCRGIGTRLLEALFAQGRALGCRDAWLGTEEANLAARRLYAKVRGREEAMVYVTFAI
jgi:catechol 2,3-dioxygenase-like lactoylglutathione lyase family enzyme/ribosomal protein S18 acetylase RimI-like enzyme